MVVLEGPSILAIASFASDTYSRELRIPYFSFKLITINISTYAEIIKMSVNLISFKMMPARNETTTPPVIILRALSTANF